MIQRRGGYLAPRTEAAPEASERLERDGYAVLRDAFAADEVAALRDDVLRVFEELPPDVRRAGAPPELWHEFRYEMLNRSARSQKAIADRRILDVVEPLLGEDCHVIANTAWRNPPRADPLHGGGFWHIDAGPHIPRPAGVAWDDRIPYPVFAVAVHILLRDCPADCGATAAIPGSHKSGQAPPRDRLADVGLTWEGRAPVLLEARAGDLLLFVSDVWHRRMPTGAGDEGRLFLQVHYGRRDIAQRLRTSAQAHQVSEEALARAASPRERSLLGLHDPLFYDG